MYVAHIVGIKKITIANRSRLQKALLLLLCALFLSAGAVGEAIAVRHREGLLHGFLNLRTLDGELLADGDLTQVGHGDRITTHMVLHFKDGSTHDETTVYLQRKSFQLVSDHLIQKGPSFPHPKEVSFETSSGKVSIRYTEKDGKEDVRNENVKIPADISNGMVSVLLKNLGPSAQTATVSMLVATPKPRIVKLLIHREAPDKVSTSLIQRTATHFVVKVDIGGVAGLVAPVIGKQPADTGVWILEGEAPAFLKSEGPLFEGGPVWRIELTHPVWPK